MKDFKNCNSVTRLSEVGNKKCYKISIQYIIKTCIKDQTYIGSLFMMILMSKTENLKFKF